MAVATPLLEREKNQSAEVRTTYSPLMSADELHNSKIKENYRRLVDPDFYLNEDRGGSAEQAVSQPAVVSAPAYNRIEEVVRPAEPYLVRNARADAEIFRADSAVNQRSAVVTASSDAEEEESEDLRPTQTTIQYRTVGESNATRTETRMQAKERILGKREKIIIATFVSVVLALFVLVIVNSVIISNLNGDLSSIQQGIDTARGALAGVNAEISALVSPDNIAQFAQSHGLVLR
ncbi:MAG: hypothetical protein ACI4L9_04995 [Candidatus Coproplasma sp.]